MNYYMKIYQQVELKVKIIARKVYAHFISFSPFLDTVFEPICALEASFHVDMYMYI